MPESNRYAGVAGPVVYDVARLARRLSVEHDEELVEQLGELAERAAAVARPKWVYRLASVERTAPGAEREAGGLLINDVTFQSQVLCTNLAEVQRVFPYVATCGVEIASVFVEPGDYLAEYWLEELKAQALQAAIQDLRRTIIDRYGLKKFSSMNPGSADTHVWPIEQQRPLFRVLENVEEEIGVRLTESYLMDPNKSVSGLYFETQTEFINCRLCTRENCPNRRAPYHPTATGPG